MQRRSVTSSNIASIGWDDNVLEIEFFSGHIYEYHDVPESEYQALLGASSIGKAARELAGRYTATRLK
jgi:hypothetical protein